MKQQSLMGRYSPTSSRRPACTLLAAVCLLAGLSIATTSWGEGARPAQAQPAAAQQSPKVRDPNASATLDPSLQPLPVPLADAVSHMKLIDGFQATVFAGEPDVRQPISFTIDDRGRLWVAECYSYPTWAETGRDSIVILEDTNGDGRMDKRQVFWERGANVSGIELGFGGVWVCATPNLLFIPDQNGDDIPDGEPVVVLDGWDLKARHNVFNCLKWGPDGWLYGCNGILSNSRVGPPGTPDEQRTSLNCGVWRMHPVTKAVEVVASGTTNPWGLDFDDVGEMFVTNCVIPHLFHVVPGIHFARMFGNDLNPHVYELVQSCADHIHWAGGRWQDSRGGKGKHSELGGGHAHAGAMIYLGDNWPEKYRQSVFMCNIHGNRVNQDLLERHGSSYVAKHGPDLLFSTDEWLRGLELKYGPDGAVYITDWSDTGECHDTDAHGAHHDSGRIYKLSYGAVRPVKVNLAALSDAELVKLQSHKNDWYVRHARRLLHEHAVSGRDMAAAHDSLRQMFSSTSEVTRQLRAMWALYVTGGASADWLFAQLDHPHENVRGWAIRLLCENKQPADRVIQKLTTLSSTDPSAHVRLTLASALQRIPLEQRWGIAEGLIAHAEDADDAVLPLMIWYGIEPLVPADKTRAIKLTLKSKIPLIRQHIARRAAAQ